MRVEFAEKDRLELARTEARREFDPFLWHMPDRDSYWSSIEVIYQPYYAYEEVLAVFADRPDQSTSLLSSMVQLMAHLTDEKVVAAATPSDPERTEVLGRYQRQPHAPVAADAARPAHYVYVSATREDREFVLQLTQALETADPPIHVWAPARDLLPTESWTKGIDEAIRHADCLLAIVAGESSELQRAEQEIALRHGEPIVPLLLDRGAPTLGLEVAGGQAIDFTGSFESGVQALREYLGYLISPEGERATLTRRLDEARQTLARAATDSDRLQAQLDIDDISARLARLGSHAAADNELLLRVGRDGRIQASWRGVAVASPVSTDEVDRRVLVLMSEWFGEGRFARGRDFRMLGELLYLTLFPGAVASLLN